MPINNITQTISTIPPAGARGVDVQSIFVIKQEDFQDHLQGTTVTELNTLKDQFNTRIGEINSTATTMNGYANTASAGASTATTKASEASTSASEALTSRNQASTFATNSSNSATKASQWADNNYNVLVEAGKYSAKHWATVAQNATVNKVDKVTSTDNAIVRFDGTTGAVQNSSVTVNDNGTITTQGLVSTSPLYGIGYGTGSGGTVTQLTSKSTAVTLNKPNGLIILNNAALAAGASIGFELKNSLLNTNDHVYPEIFDGTGGLGINYNCWMAWVGNGGAIVIIKNVSNSTLSDTVSIKFNVIKGAIS